MTRHGLSPAPVSETDSWGAHESGFRISRDARGALVHVRTQSGECVGCIELALYEIVREVVQAETVGAMEGWRTPPISPNGTRWEA
jgi:hypothetical protein